MMRVCVLTIVPSALLLATSIYAAPAGQSASKPNVLFIAVDDLNHWVGHLHRNPQTRTPQIDRLASKGVTFTRANCPRRYATPREPR